MTAEDLMEGGSDKFFSEVLYGGSHQGSAVNILTDKADVAAFCDTNLVNYVDAADGKINEVGTTYIANNKKVFVEKDSDTKGFFTKSGDEKFITVEDSWFDPIRELSK